MATIRTLIVDDEPEARLGLRALLEHDEQISLIGECGDGLEAVQTIEKQQPDLVLLDVQMPGLNGFGVLKKLDAETLPVVIFVTAYDQYSLRAFEVHAVDYLLKPFTNRRFHEAIDQAKQKIRSQKDLTKLAERMNALLARFEEKQPRMPNSSVNDYLTRIAVKEGERITFLNVDLIDWIEAADNYICLHVGSKSYLLRSKLGDIEKQLDPNHFLRIHRSRIVNIDRIHEMQPQGSGDCVLVLRDGTELTSSRTYREQRRRLLNPLQST
jgi:two-component system LytT family response regulator